MKAFRGAVLAAAGLAALILLAGPVEAQTKQCTVSGKVVEATTGKPVAGLKAMLLVAKGNARDVRQVTTNASGAFTTKVTAGSTVALYFVPGGADGSGAVLLDEEWMATWRPKEVKVVKDVTLKETVKTIPTRAVRLTVLAPSGKPAARATVMAGRSAAQAGADGMALIRVPASSKGAEVVVMSADQTMGVYTKLDPGKTAATVKLARPETVSGTLMGSDGKPAAGVKLQVMPIMDGQPLYQLMGAGCTTDEHGRFEMKGYGIPTYALYWDKSEGFKRGEATVTLADRTMLTPATVQRAV